MHCVSKIATVHENLGRDSLPSLFIVHCNLGQDPFIVQVIDLWPIWRADAFVNVYASMTRIVSLACVYTSQLSLHA